MQLIICESVSPVKLKERRIVTWTSQEDDILREQISIHGTDNWTLIASKFKDKTTRQCRRRWYTYLNSDFKKGGWSAEEDMLLCEAQKIYGNRWTEIAKVVSGRTDNAVKNRFTTLCKKSAKNKALMEKENSATYINDNNKRSLINNDGLQFEGALDVASPLKKLRSACNNPHTPASCSISDKGCTPGKLQLRPPFAVLAQNMNDDHRKIEGTFVKKNDPKILALMQQAELLSSLAMKVNTENTEQSSDNAWKVVENFLNKSKDTEELTCDKGEIQPSPRQPDMYDSPSSSEYSNGSTTLSTNVREQMEETQREVHTLHDIAGANGEITQTTSVTKIFARETTNQEEISVPFVEVEAEMDEDVSALLIAQFSSPLQLTPPFKSFAATVPSPQFSESERHFLMRTLGIESPTPSKSNNASQPPHCRRALIHSL